MKFGGNKAIDIPATISETIYRHLKNAIIKGELKPNEKITERQIAQIFNVSPTPVREAFQRLSAKGLITLDARRQVSVSSATIKEIVEIFEAIRVNDIYATKKAFGNLSEKDITKIRELTEQMTYFYKRKDFPHYYEINLEVHDVIWKKCKNKYLYQTLSGLSQKLFIHKNLVFELTQDPKFFAQSYQDHLDLQKAIEQREVKAAINILNSHWASGSLNTQNIPRKEERGVAIT